MRSFQTDDDVGAIFSNSGDEADYIPSQGGHSSEPSPRKEDLFEQRPQVNQATFFQTIKKNEDKYMFHKAA